MGTTTILVTGAPRSGTTPVGDILNTVPGSFTLYEPMGPTGDRRISNRFPIPGEPGFSLDEANKFHRDLVDLNLSFKSQVRDGYSTTQKLRALLFGSRTKYSYQLARLNLNRKVLVWKDPHAVFCAGLIPQVRTVVTIRPPEAHAGSFKRLGWVSKISDIYPRYASLFGDIPQFDVWMEEWSESAFGSAALLWHMIYRFIVRLDENQRQNVYLLNPDRVTGQELTEYQKLFDWLGLQMPHKATAMISCREADSKLELKVPSKVHDFNRSAKEANSYWKSILTEEESRAVREINGELWDELSSKA